MIRWGTDILRMPHAFTRQLTFGASGGIRTHKPFRRQILSLLCIPFHHTRYASIIQHKHCLVNKKGCQAASLSVTCLLLVSLLRIALRVTVSVCTKEGCNQCGDCYEVCRCNVTNDICCLIIT